MTGKQARELVSALDALTEPVVVSLASGRSFRVAHVIGWGRDAAETIPYVVTSRSDEWRAEGDDDFF